MCAVEGESNTVQTIRTLYYQGRLMRRAYLDVSQSILTAVQGSNTKKNTDLNT